MATYRFFLIDDLGGVRTTEAHDFKDELDALEQARKLADGFKVEVWQGPIRIAHVNAGDLAHSAEDYVSG